MKIIVLQNESESLEEIRRAVTRINPERADEIRFTSEPDEVLELIDTDNPVFVVTDQILGRSLRGTDLARLIKRVNSQAIVFIYSDMCIANEAVNGVIQKKIDSYLLGEHTLLANILASDLDDGFTPERIQRDFAPSKSIWEN